MTKVRDMVDSSRVELSGWQQYPVLAFGILWMIQFELW